MRSPFGVLAGLSLLLLNACASSSDNELGYIPSDRPVSVAREDTSRPPMQCVPYARQRSGVNLFGDAGNWWDQAAGKFTRNAQPSLGAVMVLTGYAGPGRAHLAVVATVVSDREIRVDHANWLNDGAVYIDDPVVDVSPDNDWSEVRVWNPRTGAWGVRTYLVQGFIGPGPDDGTARIASNE